MLATGASNLSAGNVVAVVAVALALLAISRMIYNLWLHPLSRHPGPWYMRATRLGYIYHAVNGDLYTKMLGLHKHYGNVVRIGPNELAFHDPSAWNDIHGHRSQGEDDFEKSQLFFRPVEQIETNIHNALREEHRMLRRTMANGFSDQGMKKQEVFIAKYTSQLIVRLHQLCNGGNNAVDLVKWFNFISFDIIGDLAFGESFDCLQDSEYHPWISIIMKMARFGAVIQGLAYYPTLKGFILLVARKFLRRQGLKHEAMSIEKVERRLQIEKERPDLIEGLIRRKDEWGISMRKLAANAGIIVVNGSETIATALSGATYHLLRNPEVLEELSKEIRSSFASSDEINYTSASNLPYLLACISETLRIYPPASIGMPRVVPRGGATVSGVFVPAGVVVAVHHWAMYHDDDYFTDPFEFRPERFLGDKKYAEDSMKAFQPFALGPRNCIGRPLAYLELRTILARLLFDFDLKLADETKDWSKQKVVNFPVKPPLPVFLTPVSPESRETSAATSKTPASSSKARAPSTPAVRQTRQASTPVSSASRYNLRNRSKA